MIHKTAIIDSKAIVAESAEVGPYCVIGPNVVIGENVKIQSHVIISGKTRITGITTRPVINQSRPQHTIAISSGRHSLSALQAMRFGLTWMDPIHGMTMLAAQVMELYTTLRKERSRQASDGKHTERASKIMNYATC